ncbi:hypothetical protein [Nocardioides sp. InS609-2]|uniref:hypothetical protein n=1 Tax=Nocardioides sp. InS609-2 TaxID=2760705 RepID=UPI0020C086EA|nr:hypothetical protein [Nocardioides sp. InS609-2]
MGFIGEPRPAVHQPLGTHRARTAPAIATLLVTMLAALAAVVPLTQSAQAVPAPRSATALTAAAPLSVAQARATQNGSVATVPARRWRWPTVLGAYFSHPGLTGASAFAFASGTDPGDPGDHDDYYAAALGKTGPQLESALHSIISSGVTKLSYDSVWNALKATDQDPVNANNIKTLYSGKSMPKSANGGGVDD